jgi:hypothetical protein
VLTGAGVLLHKPGKPSAAWATDIPTIAYWAVVGVLGTALGVLVWVSWRLLRTSPPRRETHPHRLPGLPTGRAATRTAGAKALLACADVLRPSLRGNRNVRAEEVGYRLGTVRGQPVWLSVEDSLLVLGPPRSGKGTNCVVPVIVEAPGAAVTTSLFTDNVTLTMRARQRHGPPWKLVPGEVEQLHIWAWARDDQVHEWSIDQLGRPFVTVGSDHGQAEFWRHGSKWTESPVDPD